MSKSKDKGEPEVKEPVSSAVQEAAEPPAQSVAEEALPAEPAPDETLEWVVSFKASTGELVKIEKLEKASGARQELTPEEYAEVAAKGVPVPEQASGDALAEHNAAHVALQAHIAAVRAAAYYQGISDYASFAGDPMSSVHSAYYRGYLDAAASDPRAQWE
jgi:hypothetical protein